MSVQEYIKAGQLDEALSVAQDDVRKAPAEAAPRVLLFQLLSILGQWERALTQLNVLKDMDANCMLLAQVFRPVLQCEALRDEVFAGRRGPLIFGEPVEWIGLLVQANQLIAQGEFPAALELRNSAFEAAEATPGTINDQPFEWIADADSRLGPLIEAIIDGKSYWVPFSEFARFERSRRRICETSFGPPRSLCGQTGASPRASSRPDIPARRTRATIR